jgi:hypothetical protein
MWWLGRYLAGAPRDDQLSTQFHSAAFVPERSVGCGDFTIEQCP